MNPPTTPTVGIDLGTSNSVLARVNDANHTEILRSSEGDLLVPSVVLFEDNHVYSGEEARLRGRSHPDRLISCVKRSLGENLPSAPVADVTLPVEVVQACILNKLRTDAERQVGKGFGAVIAVPAFFGDPQRKATADAGQMAGINVLDVINEPVAAALAFSEHSGYLSPSTSPLERRNLLVYDLGGFSFEATVLEVEAGGLKTLATDNDLHLGGHDWDFRIADYLAAAFKKQHGHDPRKDPAGLEVLLARAERAKRTLGLRRAAKVTVEFQGESLSVELTREHFLEITTGLLQRTAEISAGVLEKAGLKWADVSRVLLVGGATRMTWVRQMLWKLTGQQPDATVNAEEAVARGAAIYAHQLQAMASATGQIPRFRVTNMTTHSLGIEGVDQKTGKKVNTVLIRRGTPLPATATRKFVTKANAQKSITVVVLEGESTDPDECTKIGRATLRDLPSELSEEWPVDVTYHYSAAGRLKVDAQVRYTDRVVHLEMLRTVGMSFDTIRQWRQLVLSGAGLASMRGLLAKEHHTPIALASSGGEPAGEAQEEAGQDTGGQISPRISAMASRYASYVMGLFGRGRDSETAEVSGASDDSGNSGENAESNSKEQKS